MPRRLKLHEIAHARAGDKGDISSISVWPYDPGDYEVLKEQLTCERVRATFAGLIRGDVVRYDLDGLKGLNFVLNDALEGGVNTSLNLDGHGKSWSSLMLGIELDMPDNA